MKNLLLILVSLVFVTIFLVGCPIYEAAVEDVMGSNSTETTTSASSSSIVVTPSNITVSKGTATAFSASGGISPIAWSASNADLGSIDSVSGVFTASLINAGDLTITATDSNSSVGSTTVKVE